eukprot:TRINITY_DN22576_c0_g1_i1.p1 TRINITY_DN22576_c0_g1~~TRINITY_DN22576_c0_g1_i1.p1  ORF type:complete len:744 (-),score=155.94 TRINITY_DN22576_c0_g1_i1:256-2487(-)
MGDENRSRRMDLNLYLGLPHSPMRRGSDLGSDLALGSIPLLSEEIRSSGEMSVFMDTLDSHAPYSPTHASYTPNQNPMEPLDAPDIRIPRFEYSPYEPSMPYRFVSPLPGDESNSSSRLEYCPYTPTYVPVSISTQQTSTDPLHPDGNDTLGHVPYSPSDAPISTTGQDGSEPAVEDENNHTEYVPISPSYSPVPASQQPNEGLVDENVDPYFPLSPSYAPISRTGHDSSQPVAEDGNNNVDYVLSSPSYGPERMHIPEQTNGGLIPEDVDPYIPSSPSYIPFMPTTHDRENHSNNENLQPAGEVGLSQATMRISEPLALEGPSQQRRLQPEFRFQRLIESSHRWRIGRFRSAAPYRLDPDSGASSLNMEDHILQEVMASERSVETSGSHKVAAESLCARDTEEGMKEQGGGAANFECNICLDMAREPVVTLCGHLFCWPCLFQWLYIHCDHKECPVCKGEVTESNIIPIYGRGSSESGVEKTSVGEGDSSLKVPPRPRGHRFESLRQHIRRPFSRRLGHEISSWRRIVDEELRNGNRADGQEPPLQGSRALTRFRAAQRLRREGLRREGSSENNLWSSALSRNTTETASNSQNGGSLSDGRQGGSRSSSLLPDGFDFWQRLTLFGLPNSERIAAFTAGLSSVMERMSNIAGHSGASASTNPRNTEPLGDQGARGATPVAEQASASSTMATIQGDVGVVNTSAEANAAGSSRSGRRRRRNGASSSLDVDGEGEVQAHKRRRLN